ncbi:UDP-N-acetylmuramoyl-L-alanine--D-glutamate ligase [Zongyangia hominis]|uniref:UDP-N-acetylmuramoylalanine--D-glutamate ligase n=1 Tax=Zongyangia hominis TaxID=2763677 RepID=A0A926EE91_9FIRM|nr:UDP-N-acetylmuramoyl-L-alanine--D-glutamate ligase [Zongyangia hominis]MBC8570296.1 UDP-N-acetylmuramoyl-L-alanine--D-glutamate ligase [Zongyangia hominis]
MDSTVAQFFDQMKGRDVTFIGLGVSHRELISLFAKKGAHVTIRDRRTPEQMGEEYEKLKAQGIDFILGEHYLDKLDGDMIFRTPGMYFHHEALKKAREEGKVVTSEMEVFFDLCPAKLIAVTGSDGKTTTTTLISELLKAQGKRVHLGGNIGKPLLSHIEEMGPEDYAVVELSSFQLLSMRQSPDIAVVTNIAPNHLDVHGTMEEYIAAKKNILLHQNAFSTTVLGVDNELAASLAPDVRGKLVTFSMQGPVERGAYMDEAGDIFYADSGNVLKIMNRDAIKIPGDHNVLNFLAAISATWGLVSLENIVKIAENFGGVEHRIELVRIRDGVRWYNDSIATSPTRTIAGLNAFKQKVILIAGGYDKKIPFLPLAPKIIEKVKALILMGATADKIEDTVRGFSGFDGEKLPIYRVGSMEEAVQKAAELAVDGDIVTLSPACASFDLYQNFETRGEHFKSLVRAL